MNRHERNHDFILLMYKELDWWHEKSIKFCNWLLYLGLQQQLFARLIFTIYFLHSISGPKS